jgi:SAM-dependent methyltransferase
MSNIDYGSSSYWDERYSADEACYDWYQDYNGLKEYLVPFLPAGAEREILIPGCGNSMLGPELYNQGHVNITNVDISAVVVNQMTDLHSDKEEMEYSVMDARKMEFIPDQCFDLIIEKALSDAILCSENNLKDVDILFREMWRVLKTGGTYLIISHAPPSRRLQFITKSLGNMDIEVMRIPKVELNELDEEGESKFHFMYVMRKSQT